jgi:hypothetical protein
MSAEVVNKSPRLRRNHYPMARKVRAPRCLSYNSGGDLPPIPPEDDGGSNWRPERPSLLSRMFYITAAVSTTSFTTYFMWEFTGYISSITSRNDAIGNFLLNAMRYEATTVTLLSGIVHFSKGYKKDFC